MHVYTVSIMRLLLRSLHIVATFLAANSIRIAHTAIGVMAGGLIHQTLP